MFAGPNPNSSARRRKARSNPNLDRNMKPRAPRRNQKEAGGQRKVVRKGRPSVMPKATRKLRPRPLWNISNLEWEKLGRKAQKAYIKKLTARPTTRT